MQTWAVFFHNWPAFSSVPYLLKSDQLPQLSLNKAFKLHVSTNMSHGKDDVFRVRCNDSFPPHFLLDLGLSNFFPHTCCLSYMLCSKLQHSSLKAGFVMCVLRSMWATAPPEFPCPSWLLLSLMLLLPSSLAVFLGLQLGHTNLIISKKRELCFLTD